MTDYTNYMPSTYIAPWVKWTLFILVTLNIIIYKKFKISRYIEEKLSHYIMTYASLSFILLSVFLFFTSNRDLYLEVFSIILGICMSLSYIYCIYKDASEKKLGKRWFLFLLIYFIDAVLFFMIPNKTYGFLLGLLQNLIFMIYETNQLNRIRKAE